MFPKKVIDNRRSNRKKTGQKELFAKIWNERPHICCICPRTIPEPLNICFAHNLSKGVYPEYKFNENNISLVCSIECHQELDRRNAGNQQELIKLCSL